MRIALIGARRSPMRILGILSISAVLIVGITILFYLIYLEPASSSPHENAGLRTVVEMRPDILEQYPSVNDLRQNDCVGPNNSICIDDAIKKTLKSCSYCIYSQAGKLANL